MTQLKLALVAAAFAASVTPAAIADEVQTRSIAVDISDIDQTTPAGMKSVERRLRSAARAVCDDGSGRVGLKEHRAYRTCFNAAISGALSSLSGPEKRDFVRKENSQG